MHEDVFMRVIRVFFGEGVCLCARGRIIKNEQKHMHIFTTLGEILETEDVAALVATAVFGEGEACDGAREKIQELAEKRGIFLASIDALYRAFGNGEASGFTVPAMNMRMMAFDQACATFREAKKMDAGAFVFEIAPSEMTYTNQTPEGYSACILGAAIVEGWTGPVFVQGDHVQFHAEMFAKNREEEIERIQKIVQKLIGAGFYNIDIDASTLVNLQQESLLEQQRNNFEMTALLTSRIRSIEPKGMTISVGGEIGHIGGKNTTVAEFEIFMDEYAARIGDAKGLSKVSVQTGTSHGGTVSKEGTLVLPEVDFSVLHDITRVAREKYGIGGTVQHGTSTLPDELMSKFLENDAMEAHFSTGFQNAIFDAMPKALCEEMHAWTKENLENERAENMTDEQFVYKLRKKSIGHFQRRLWELTPEEKMPIQNILEKKIAFLFSAFHMGNSKQIVEKFVVR